MNVRAIVIIVTALGLGASACDDGGETAITRTTEPAIASTTGPAPAVTSAGSDDGSATTAASTVPAPITDPVIEVVQEGRPEAVAFEGEIGFEERRATGPTSPGNVAEPWDVQIELVLDDSWLDPGGFAMCGWTASRAFADGCVDAGVFVPGVPWRFGASSTGDDRFELWLTGVTGIDGRRLLVADPSRLGPGVHRASFIDSGITIAEVLTQPPGATGDYLEIG